MCQNIKTKIEVKLSFYKVSQLLKIVYNCGDWKMHIHHFIYLATLIYPYGPQSRVWYILVIK